MWKSQTICVLTFLQYLFAYPTASQNSDSNCPIISLPPHSDLTLLTESEKELGVYWVTPGEDFKRIVIQVQIRNTFVPSTPYIPDEFMEFTKNEIFPPNILENKTLGRRLTIKVFKKKRIFRNKLVVRAVINKKIKELDLDLWWRQYVIKKYIVLGEGAVTFSASKCVAPERNKKDMNVTRLTLNNDTRDDSNREDNSYKDDDSGAQDDSYEEEKFDAEYISTYSTNILMITLAVILALILITSCIMICLYVKRVKRKRREQEDSPYEELAFMNKYRQQSLVHYTSQRTPPVPPPSLPSRIDYSVANEALEISCPTTQTLRDNNQQCGGDIDAHYITPLSSSQVQNLYDVPKSESLTGQFPPSPEKNNLCESDYLPMSGSN